MKQVFVDLKNFVRFCHISGDITAVQYASICQCINKAAGEIPKPVPEIPKPGKTKAKTTKISMGIGQEAADRCERLRLIFHSECTESQFARIIFHAGLEHYEKNILPLETEGNTSPRTEARIIPFPAKQAAGTLRGRVAPEALNQRREQ